MPNEIDLTSLSATERTILALLAQGHTAKSIAAEIGRTEGAVNERLREARRKTGVGSSRELARLVRTQENRDEQTGVVPGAPVPSAPDGAPRVVRQPAKAILMTLPFLAIVAAVVLHGAGQRAPTPPAPPVGTDDGLDRVADTLSGRFAREVRDPAWATRTEAALMDRYRAIGGRDLAALSVACRSTLCAVQGQGVSRVANGDWKRLSDSLGSTAMRSSVPGIHADVTHASGFAKDGSFVISFNAMWRRTDRD